MRATPRLGPALAVGLATVALLVACERAEVDLSGSTAVGFESADGVALEGRLFGDGTSAVVLSHMRPADQSSWFDLADRLADAGYLVLTYDFRGYCPGGEAGCSGGERDVDAIWQDVLGAIDFVRSRGATSVSLVGASMGGTASLVAAGQEGADIRSVITLSAPVSIEGLVADASLLTRIAATKLFIAGVGDAPAAADAQALYERSPPPKRVEIVPSDDHGTDLLTGGRGEVVRRLIETFLEQAGGP
ncbi:MAG TPA: alpha/beta fold hydrolase [Actinomycetota bacterium]|jgi:dienelactone hydrolase